MNLATALIFALILVAMFFAIKYTRKHGTCSCGSEGCHGGGCASCAMKPIEEEQERKFMEEWNKKFPEYAKKNS